MPQATLNLIVVPKRILTKAEAAFHCGRPVSRFVVECPVQPLRFANGDERYDIRDLDEWLDGVKTGDDKLDVNAILNRLR
jgi:hypothetical protein